MPETIRCFLAVEMTEAVVRSLERLLTRLALPQFQVRWVQPKNMHLTLRFLGDITRQEATTVTQAAQKAASGTNPFPVRLHGLGTFPPSGSPRIVWVGMEDDRAIVRLERQLSLELTHRGWPPSDKPFRAHLTLGRVKSPRGVPGLREHLQRNAAAEMQEMTAEHLSLVQSVLRPSGPLYTVLERFAFGLQS